MGMDYFVILYQISTTDLSKDKKEAKTNKVWLCTQNYDVEKKTVSFQGATVILILSFILLICIKI